VESDEREPDLEALPSTPDWTVAASDEVAPWRRADRARLDRDAALSDAEFVAAVRAVLAP
jgi:hypothetical protein